MSVVLCPRCQIALKKVRLGLICRKCEGCWLRYPELDRAIVVSKEALLASGLKATLEADTPNVDLSGDVMCPICNEKCRRFPYLVDSGVIVDACSEHGMWLDDGELGKIRAYCREHDAMPEIKKKKPGFFARLFGRKG